ncbi:MAG TPA: RHS repeat-associated core domain-containing protein [Rhodanobacteraceae bacterium]|nr:RHS repeat-associated core domain-containing protein [Rhodanobacteraceae bacterium]
MLAGLLVMVAYLLTGAAYAQQSNTVTKVTLIMTDAQGNVLMTTDVHGNVLAHYTYRPYGMQQSGPTNKGPGYTGHVNDPNTGLVYMQQRYYDPDGRFISPDPIGPTPGNIYSFNRYAYANNNPVRFVDPDGRKCATVDGKASCTFDEFKDKDGNIISRKQALSSGGVLAKLFHADGKHRILGAEAAMTKKYVAAKKLAASGGSVVIKGNEAKGIPNQTVAGSTIVSHMETITVIATAQSGGNLIAGTPPGKNGAPSDGPITFYKDGAAGSDISRTYGHEILHTIYSGVGVPGYGWANPANNLLHQKPFNDASDAIY